MNYDNRVNKKGCVGCAIICLLVIGGIVTLGVIYRAQITDFWCSFNGDDNTPENIAEYIKMCNEYRLEDGFDPLIFTDDLNKNAYQRVKEIQNYFSHYSPGGYNTHLAENIVMDSNGISTSGALYEWQHSWGHRVNLHSGKYSGFAIEDGYAVQLFSDYPTIDGVPQLPPGIYWDDSPSQFNY